MTAAFAGKRVWDGLKICGLMPHDKHNKYVKGGRFAERVTIK